MNDNPLYEMFSTSEDSLLIEGWDMEELINAQKKMEADIFRAVNNLNLNDVHPTDKK
jgi:hypothetical protein